MRKSEKKEKGSNMSFNKTTDSTDALPLSTVHSFVNIYYCSRINGPEERSLRYLAGKMTKIQSYYQELGVEQDRREKLQSNRQRCANKIINYT